MSEKHNHYFRDCPYDKIDVYRIIDIFEITDPAAQHILKKCIATGKRGHKDEERDWQDIVDSAQRRLQMLAEDKVVDTVKAVREVKPFPGVIASSTYAQGSGVQLCAADPNIPPLPPIYNRRETDKIGA